jgi:hypothetical protein
MLDRTDRPTSVAAKRQREYRRCKKAGLIKLTIEINQGEIADLLVDLGLLQEWDTEDRAKVRAVFESALRSGALRITRFEDCV